MPQPGKKASGSSGVHATEHSVEKATFAQLEALGSDEAVLPEEPSSYLGKRDRSNAIAKEDEETEGASGPPTRRQVYFGITSVQPTRRD